MVIRACVWRHFLRLAALSWPVVLLLSPVNSEAGYGNDLGTYNGTFNNLDTNQGSYLSWVMTFGDSDYPVDVAVDVGKTFGFGYPVSFLHPDSVSYSQNVIFATNI